MLAAICNALMDTLEHHFDVSIFRNLNPKFWNPNVSWQYAYIIPFTKYKVDAWHLAKSLMIICLAFACANTWYMFIILGIIWNSVFNIFYNRIF